MPQIAQQDHLFVHVNDIEQLTAEEIAVLKEKAENGTILDVVLVETTESGNYAKIIAGSKTQISYYNVPGTEIITVGLE